MDRPTGSSHAAFTMAALTAGLGVYGYMSKRSMPSLVAGVAFGAVYAASGYLINNGRDEYGHIVGAVASAALVGVMGPKYMKTRAAFPPGVLAVSGAVVGSYDTYKGVQVWRNLLEE
ncbi:hypothetical protein FNF27_01445 [Cafeteria roenbergensis]|jgi:uncharacterized membrane protein (UPF0136 family)|uniref:Transmembrane protein 14C n=2 Tax=Cafeteria roenbergensis TaxID=33653 RepID=A0A5A8EGU1_CAFRO|nr:hypothetical protein FNF31_04219 [Cafeteria roenbergensis]KAA0177115.1 hypothetical protein FNF27_01445 [Cafeteria roenbergensis]